MKDEQHIARIYDLIEKYDFIELSEDDKELVLRHFSLNEYSDLRSTIADTKELFSKYPEGNKKTKLYQLRKIVMYRVELYKIAATILIIAGATYLFSTWDNSNNQKLIASVDTVYVKKTDTVLVYVGDTNVKIKENTEHKEFRKNISRSANTISISEGKQTERDCSKELCPKDIEKLNALKGKNDFSNDKSLTDFMVSFN
jgi:hypothetical protein